VRRNRWRLLTFVIGVSLLLPISIVFADEAVGNRGRVRGESYILASTATYAEYWGRTQVGPEDFPDEMYLYLDLFKGGEWIPPGIQKPALPGIRFVSWTYDPTTSLPGAWQGCAWHYAYWMAEIIERTAVQRTIHQFRQVAHYRPTPVLICTRIAT